MAFRVDDRVLWLGFGAFLLIAAKGVQYALTDLVRLTEIDPHQYEPKKKREQSEDAIAIGTLRTLIASPDHSISTAATSVAISRMSGNTEVQKMLWADLASNDPGTRSSARTAIRYLKPISDRADFVFQKDAMGRTLANEVSAVNEYDSNDDRLSFSSGDVLGSEHDDAPPDAATLQLEPFEQEINGPWVLPPFRGPPDILVPDEPVQESSEVSRVANAIARWIDVPPELGPVDEETAQQLRRMRREAMALLTPDHEVERADEEEDLLG